MKTAWMKAAVVSATALLGVATTGCVAQRTYDDLNTLYRQSLEQNQNLRAQIEEANARIKALQEMERAGGGNDAELRRALAQALADRDRAQKALDEAIKMGGTGAYEPIILERDLDQALRDLAAQHPELMEYDPAKGMVKFRSDLTFALGSTEVSREAQQALGQLADILKRQVAQRYEARIVGHTDNVRIAKPQTREKYPTNWHLAAGRAIAVKDVLQGAGVPPVRLGIAGYGEYRPVVANANRGAEANRRVEIYLVPNTYQGMTGGDAPAPAPAPGAGRAAPREEPGDEAPAQPDEAPDMFK